MPALREVQVLARSGLNRAIASALGRASARAARSISAMAQSQGPAILVVASSECSPADCARLADEGRDVVVLAAIPSPLDEDAYRAAGAASYLPMSIDTMPLVAALDAIEAARARKPGEAVLPQALLENISPWGAGPQWT